MDKLFEHWRKFLKEDYPFNTKAKGSGRIGVTGINAQDDALEPESLWSDEEDQEDASIDEKKKKKPYVEPALQDDYITTEDYQKDISKTHQKEKKRIITTGANKTKAAPFVKNPETKRSKSSPPGFGGSP